MISLVLATFKSVACAAVSRRVRKPTPATDPAAVAASPPPPPPHVLLEVATETDVEGEPVGGVTQPVSLLKSLSGKLRVRWPFMRWVCTIVLWQLLLTAAVVVVCLSLQSVLFEHLSSHPGAISIAYLVLFFISMTMMVLLWILQHRRTINVLLLALCTVSVTPFVGASTIFLPESPKVTLIVSTILSPTMVVVLTAYTLWAATPARRLYDSLLVFHLACGSLLFLYFYFLAQRALIPCRKAVSIFHGCVVTLIFSGHFVADMDNLVAGQNQEEYVMMAMSIYLDVISLFVGLLSFGGSKAGCM
uniref:BI1-like protein n=1 Tax=Anthurium amnicola TaxID=1678845 RepID=A0A1D1Y0T6_9ARAE